MRTDDDLPPPPATVTIEGKGEEPISGWSYEQIGQHSRAFHLTQGMGRWVAPEDERNWPLHLARSCVSTSDENSISAGLPTTLASLADFADAASIQPLLQQADEEILTAIEAYPTLSKTRQAASKALSLVRQAQTECPADARNEVDHRLRQKESQLASVIRLATRAKIRPRLDSDVMHRGDVAALTIETEPGDSDALECSVILPTGWQHKEGSVHILEHATPRPCYPDRYLPDEPAAPALQVMLSVDGQTSQTFEALETPPLLLPKHSAQLSPSSVLLNTANSLNEFQIDIMNSNPAESAASLQLPERWSAVANKAGFNITVPADTDPGRYEIGLRLDDQPALTVNWFDFPHIKPRMRAYKASVQVCVLNMEIPAIRVGYIGGGNDRVAERLSEMGFNVEVLSDEKILNPDTYRELDTLVVGIFAVRMRPVLQQILPRIHEWVEAGGNLLTLYHRPWDDWNENTVPPRRLLIGKPSLRWRVTDEQATVNYLLPKHPLLNTPNVIDADDWLGWHKERGLYFAADWDAAYEALLSMSDPDEQPLTGSLVSACIGEGRHTHTSLILHHQMEQLVTGAYRLMANLVVGAR